MGPCKAPKGTNTKVTSAEGHFCAYPTEALCLTMSSVHEELGLLELRALVELRLERSLHLEICLFNVCFGESDARRPVMSVQDSIIPKG